MYFAFSSWDLSVNHKAAQLFRVADEGIFILAA